MKKEVAAGFVIVGVAAALAVFATNQNMIGNRMINLFGSATDTEFMKYVSKFGKSYGTKAEFSMREAIFEENLRMVRQHNSLPDQTYRLGINRFSDMTTKELSLIIGGVIGDDNDRPEMLAQSKKHKVGGTPVNWTSYMNPIKDQGNCASCWAFASIAATEGRYAIKYGNKVQLSEQHLVDCDKKSYGCKKGHTKTALHYLQQNGAMSEQDYPYLIKDGECKNNPEKSIVRVSEIWEVQDLKESLSRGPVGANVQSMGQFISHESGIFNGRCGRQDHAVTVVGWGIENDIEFWIIRNSLGPTWGQENGYIRVQINGNCQIFTNYEPILA